MRFIDLTGMEFGRLKVIKRCRNRLRTNGIFWKCCCICGKIKEIEGASLRSGDVKSCGCLRIEFKHRPNKYEAGKLICSFCKKPIITDTKPSHLKKRKFCSLKCTWAARSTDWAAEHNRIITCKTCKKDMVLSVYSRKQYCSVLCFKKKWSDGNGPFRDIVSRKAIRSKLINVEFNLTVSILKKQWEKQNGICPYTGWKLHFTHNGRKHKKEIPEQASLDRIDSSKGYVPDNIQFVALQANYAKNCFSENELVTFCDEVSKYHT